MLIPEAEVRDAPATVVTGPGTRRADTQNTSAARNLVPEPPMFPVPFDESVFERLAALPDKVPELPYAGDDDL